MAARVAERGGRMRRAAIVGACALSFLTACGLAPEPTPLPTLTTAERQERIAAQTQVAINLTATAESRAATATAAAIPTVAPTLTPTIPRPAAGAGPGATAPPVTPVVKIADFRMTAYQGDASLGGRHSRLSNVFAYGLPVVVNFWAPLCPPCREEMPAFQRVSDDYAGRVFFLGVDVSPFAPGFGGQAEATQLIRDTGIHYPVAYALDSPTETYKVRSIPTTVFFAADGTVIKTVVGDLSEAGLRANVQNLLAAAPTGPGVAASGGSEVPRPVAPSSARLALPPRSGGRP
jgi:thiol-disulfide isomerase/thioredoxin